MLKLNPTERKAVTDYIDSICAVVLDPSKDDLIEGRLAALAEEVKVTSYGHLVLRARTDASGSLNRGIIGAITTGETLFFPDTAPFDALRHKVIPDLIDRRSRAGSSAPIRIWSAACPSGQAVYTRSPWSSRNSLEIRVGLYSAIEMARGLPANRKDTYFTARGDSWQIRDEIRALASFRTLKLTKDFSTLGRFDVIFCRNVAICFTDIDRADLFRRIEGSLERNGYLFIGAMKSLGIPGFSFESQRHVRAVLYQAKAAIRKAS